jgi:hypothetical protein
MEVIPAGKKPRKSRPPKEKCRSPDIPIRALATKSPNSASLLRRLGGSLSAWPTLGGEPIAEDHASAYQ